MASSICCPVELLTGIMYSGNDLYIISSQRNILVLKECSKKSSGYIESIFTKGRL